MGKRKPCGLWSARFDVRLPAAAATAVSALLLQIAQLERRLLSEACINCPQTVLKVRGLLGRSGTRHISAGTGRVGTGPALAGRSASLRSPGGTLRRIIYLFNGEIDSVGLVNANDFNLDLLSLLQVIADLIDIGISNLGDVDQAGAPSGSATNAPNFVIPVTLPSKMDPTPNSILTDISSL